MTKDLKYAWRTLWKTPGFTAVAIIALALGIGANTAMFTIVRAVVLKPLPFRDPDRLVQLYETFLPSGWGTVSTPNFADWRAQNHSFDGLAGYTITSRNLQGSDAPERLRTLAVTSNAFDFLGVQAKLGRTLAAGEDQPEKPNVAVLSDRLWSRRFTSDPKIIGRTLTLDGEPYTVIGVMPASFDFPLGTLKTDLWVPLKPPPQLAANRGSHWMFAIGRLKSGVARSAALADMTHIAEGLDKAYPDSQSGRRVRIDMLSDVVSGRVRPVLLVLLSAVGVVLLIACVNVANLLLARGASRGREIAVRAALGAARGRLVRLLLIESLLLAVLGAVAGSALAWWGVDLLTALAAKVVPRLAEVQFDAGVFLFLFAISILTAFVFGIMPALRISGTAVNDGLREGGSKGSVGGPGQWLRHSLVAAELALAFVLLIAGGMLMRVFLKLANTETGLNAQNVLTFQVSLPAAKYEGDTSTRFFQQVLERLKAAPGVRAAGAINLLPLQNWGNNGDFYIEGRPPAQAGQNPFAEMRVVTPGYFAALNIPVQAGRDLSDADAKDAPAAVIVNRALAAQYFPNENPIGRRLGWPPNNWNTIVGVVGDVRQSGLDRKTAPELYLPIAQSGANRSMTVVVSAGIEPDAMTSAARAAVLAVDPDQPIFGVKAMQTVVADSLSSQRMNFLLMTIFSALAVILASAGIYGVMSYLVSQRTREFGLRLALGARSSDVFSLVIRESLLVTAIGVGAGIGASFGAAKILSSYIPGVDSASPLLFLAVAGLLAAVVVVATLVPARRAMTVDPMEALRWE